MPPVFHIVIGGIITIALVYVLIDQSSSVHSVARSATHAYANVVTTFQGK